MAANQVEPAVGRGKLVKDPIAEAHRHIDKFAAEHGSEPFNQLMMHLEVETADEQGYPVTGWIVVGIFNEDSEADS